MREGWRHLLEAGVAIERRVENSSHGRHKHREQEEINEHDDQADEQAGDATKISSNNHQADSGQHEHHRNEAEAEAADDFFSPRVAEELGGALHRGDGSEVLEGQHGNDEITSKRPDYSDDANNHAAEPAPARFHTAT